MDCENYQMMIQEFNDGELEKGKEPLIFTHLSQCAECRDFMKGLNQLNLIAQEEVKEFPDKLDEKIMRSVEMKELNYNKNIFTIRVPAYISYALGIIIILVGYYFMSSTYQYRQELHEAVNVMREQNQQMQLIMNSMPEVQVQSKMQNEVIIQAKM
jgi:predicted anti-sigma-YlaC factor YlaD